MKPVCKGCEDLVEVSEVPGGSPRRLIVEGLLPGAGAARHVYQPGLLFVPFGLSHIEDITVGEFYSLAAGGQISFT